MLFWVSFYGFTISLNADVRLRSDIMLSDIIPSDIVLWAIMLSVIMSTAV